MKNAPVLLLVALLCGCGPTRHFTGYEHKEGEGTWINGDHYFTKEFDSVEVTLAHITSNTFRFNIVNHSSRPVLISPELCYYVGNTRKDSIDKTLNVPRYATDPESVIAEARMQQEKEFGHVPRPQAFLGLMNDVSEIAVQVNNKPKEEKRQELKEIHRSERNRIETYNAEMQAHNEKIYSIGLKLEYWMYKALRKTTLMSGHEMTGEILFNIRTEPANLIVVIPVNGVNLPFEFKAKYTTY